MKELHELIKYLKDNGYAHLKINPDLLVGIIEYFASKKETKQCTITDVGCSFSIGFAQYIAKEHYTLVNQIGKIHYWRNEEFAKTTEQLLKDYKETLT